MCTGRMLRGHEGRDRVDGRTSRQTQGSAEATRSERRGTEQLLPHSLGKVQPCRHLDLGRLTPTLCVSKFLSVKPPGVWCCVVAAPANQSNHSLSPLQSGEGIHAPVTGTELGIHHIRSARALRTLLRRPTRKKSAPTESGAHLVRDHLCLFPKG